MFQLILYLTAATITALLMFATHWYPWHNGTRRRPDRLTAYTIGAIGLIGIPVLAMAITEALDIHPPVRTWIELLILNTIAAGAATHLAYWIDGRRALTLEDTHAQPRRQ